MCFPGKFMNFSEADIGGVLRKKLILKLLQYSQKSCNTHLQHDIFKNTYFEEHLQRLLLFFKTATEHR